MYYVYVLKSEKKGFIYVGSTNDLKRRLFEHNNGNVRSTKFYMPLRLVYYEAYLEEKDALEREYRLKHHGSVIGHLKKRLFYSLKSFNNREGIAPPF